MDEAIVDNIVPCMLARAFFAPTSQEAGQADFRAAVEILLPTEQRNPRDTITFFGFYCAWMYMRLVEEKRRVYEYDVTVYAKDYRPEDGDSFVIRSNHLALYFSPENAAALRDDINEHLSEVESRKPCPTFLSSAIGT